MKKPLLLLILLLLLFQTGIASKKDDVRMKAAEQALSEGKYADVKAVFEDLKDNPQYRQKCYLYLAMIYHQNGQVENALASINDFKRYITDKTDISLLTASQNLEEEIGKSYDNLEIAIFDQGDKNGVDPGFYNLAFRSDGGLNPAQEARLKFINKIISQSQGLFAWKSDGTFLKGKIKSFPIRLYDTSPMTAEINGIPIYFRFDFQIRQGLWIPSEVIDSAAQARNSTQYQENSEPLINQEKPKKSHGLTYILIGAAAILAAGIALALSQ
jgi:hypothetical protein